MIRSYLLPSQSVDVMTHRMNQHLEKKNRDLPFLDDLLPFFFLFFSFSLLLFPRVLSLRRNTLSYVLSLRGNTLYVLSLRGNTLYVYILSNLSIPYIQFVTVFVNR
eukprot:Lithocolla_globosa_v1_NODE_826_length_3223_cov_15.526515.p5 type:complete len:106 gc:universal NODE_826_length_3223_cov_15.526515:1303-986(-)